jgi:hypothetical protein
LGLLLFEANYVGFLERDCGTNGESRITCPRSQCIRARDNSAHSASRQTLGYSRENFVISAVLGHPKDDILANLDIPLIVTPDLADICWLAGGPDVPLEIHMKLLVGWLLAPWRTGLLCHPES